MQDYISIKTDINGNIPAVTVKQFDSNSRFLHVTLTDSDLPEEYVKIFEMEGCSARLLVTLGHDKYAYVDGEIADAEGGIVTFLLPGSVTQRPGTYLCEIRITEPESGALISTKPFKLTVEESINADSAIQATPQYSALETSLMLSGTLNSRMNAIDERMDRITAMTETGEIPEGTVESEVIDARTGWNGTVYQSLAAAILGQTHGSLGYLGTLLNAQTWATYNSTFGGLPTNIFTVCNLDNSGGTISDAPILGQLTGMIITLGRESKTRRANFDTQIFITQDCGKIYIRKYYNNAWSAWATVGGTYLETLIGALPQFRGGINDEYAAHDNQLSDVTDEGTFFATPTATVGGETVTRWADLPTSNQNYIVTNAGYSNNWMIQTAIPTDAVTTVYRRKIPRSAAAGNPGDWECSVSPDPRMKVLALGDSICRGGRNSLKGFVGDLRLPYKNAGVSGASLSTISTTHDSTENIPARLIRFFGDHSTTANENNDGWEPDVILTNGGHNDYNLDAELGEIPTQPAASIESLDDSTVLGGLQKLFLLMITYYPHAQRFFITTHKIFRNATSNTERNGYLPTKENSRHYTETQLYDAIAACCKVYNVKVIDVFNDSLINSYFTQYRGTTYYANNDAGASADTINYFDKDGVHPLARGYLEGYVPLIREAIRVGTVKGSDT